MGYRKFSFSIFHHLIFPVLGILVLALLPHLPVIAQTSAELNPGALKKLSIEELMDIEVTTVSRRSEKLTESASAVQVITQEDIRHSGATTLPEALRLASNLQVAQANASQWAISARGFNNVLANKLLVMIDGRAVYTPMYAGVFWDVQNVLLEDVDRIEVISGPGGALWGANAVNGVINIITKSSKDTKGFFMEVARGSKLKSLASARYGGRITDKITYRVYATDFKHGNTILTDSIDANDAWTIGQGGFRFDWDASEKSTLTLLSNFYDGKPNPDGTKAVLVRGGNAIGRWVYRKSERFDLQIQAYYDETWRDFRNNFTENLKTYDIDAQNRFQLGQRHEFVWGLGFRLMDYSIQNLELFGFFPGNKTLSIYNAFVQDKISLIKNRLQLTLGSKFEHSTYGRFQYQPSGRLSYNTKRHDQILWAAISRAVRTPSRIDRDFSFSIAPGIPVVTGAGDNFISETVIAYEAGWRFQPNDILSLSLSLYVNHYNHIRSAEPGPPPLNIPIVFSNGVAGDTWGNEFSVIYQVRDWWRIRGGYTFLWKDLYVKPFSEDANDASAESNDPENQYLIQSTMNLRYNIEFGMVIRYIDKLSKPEVPAYAGLDLRLGWKLNDAVQLSIVGQNLIKSDHAEFIPSSPSPRELERSVYGKITCRF